MGVQASKELSTIVLEACNAAEQAGGQQLDEFFSDVHIEAFQKFWLALSVELRKKINPSQHRAVQTIAKSRSSVILSTNVQNKLTHWSSNINTFFEEDLIEQPRSEVNLVTNLLSCLLVLDQRATTDEVRWRISTVALYRIKSQISDRCRLSEDDEQILLRFLTQLEVQPKYHANAVRWANIGKRYDSLASDLGGLGSLAVLPSDLPRGLWETRLPLKDEPRTDSTRTDSITLLKIKGVPEVAKKSWDTANGKICANSAVELIVVNILISVDANTIVDLYVVRIAHTIETEKENTTRRIRKHPRGKGPDHPKKRRKRRIASGRNGTKSARSRETATLHGVTASQSTPMSSPPATTRIPATENDGAENDWSAPVMATPGNDTQDLELNRVPAERNEQPCENTGDLAQELEQILVEGLIRSPPDLEQFLQQDLLRYQIGLQQESVQQGLIRRPMGLLVQGRDQRDLDQMLADDWTGHWTPLG